MIGHTHAHARTNTHSRVQRARCEEWLCWGSWGRWSSSNQKFECSTPSSCSRPVDVSLVKIFYPKLLRFANDVWVCVNGWMLTGIWKSVWGVADINTVCLPFIFRDLFLYLCIHSNAPPRPTLLFFAELKHQWGNTPTSSDQNFPWHFNSTSILQSLLSFN